MGIPHELFEEKLEAMKVAKGFLNDTQLNVNDLEDLVAEYKDVYVATKGEQFPSGMHMRIPHLLQNINSLSVELEWQCYNLKQDSDTSLFSSFVHICRSKKAVAFGNLGCF